MRNVHHKEFIPIIPANIEMSDQEIGVNKILDFENTPIITKISAKKSITSINE